MEVLPRGTTSFFFENYDCCRNVATNFNLRNHIYVVIIDLYGFTLQIVVLNVIGSNPIRHPTEK